MARGLTNTVIAAGLFVGEATVKTHVSRVMTKPGARDRIQPSCSPMRTTWLSGPAR
jgi:DNA-binding NarL/FixJ family response regulator